MHFTFASFYCAISKTQSVYYGQLQVTAKNPKLGNRKKNKQMNVFLFQARAELTI